MSKKQKHKNHSANHNNESPAMATEPRAESSNSDSLKSGSRTHKSTHHDREEKGHHQLGEFASTAICGNDITSSCLYVSAFAIGAAGKMAPISLLIVAFVLFLFRRIYEEVVGALPLNGGAYNALLNTTSKARASVAACLTILSYMATAVISAGEAMHYGAVLLPSLGNEVSLLGLHTTYVNLATAGLLAFFAGLTIMGITESSRVAIGIFVTHILTLTLLLSVGICFIVFADGGKTFRANWATELSVSDEVDDAEEVATDVGAALEGPDTVGHSKPKRFKVRTISLFEAIFFGFCVSLLGISGFESSSNFVEEQSAGVFPKTLRNMWVTVSFFNPAMAFLALALVPIITIQQDPDYELGLLAQMGFIAGGSGGFGTKLSQLISIDAILVLSGAVLTSFVGVNGLVGRMTLDRCLPQFLLKLSPRGTTHRILIAFFLMCISVLFITEGKIKVLAGVYTISFLTVMALFGVGNVLLKVKRSKLPRPAYASWPAVVIAISAVIIGLIGNAWRNPKFLFVFLYYFIPASAFVAVMLYRISLLRGCLYLVRTLIGGLIIPMRKTTIAVRSKIDEINSQQVVFFTRGDNVANLNNAMQYVAENEDTNRIKVVTVVNDKSEVPEKLRADLTFLDEAYPQIDIDFVVLEGRFGPELIQKLSKEWSVPTNLMFIGSPGGKLVYGLAELGGVRLII